MIADEIFNSNMIFVGIQRLGFIVHGPNAMAEYIEIGNAKFQLLCEFVALIMQGVPLTFT